MTFKDLGFSSELLKIIESSGYKIPFPVQQQAIPPILKDKDVLTIAKTGSGKTDCFLLPVIEKTKLFSYDKNRSIQALILVPTRELAVQIGDILHSYCSQLRNKIRTKAVYGGVSINPQMKSMYGVQILVATPGRLIDLFESNALRLNDVHTFVMDEADKLLNLGFEKEMETILKLLPPKRQNLLFSATLSEHIVGLQKVLLKNPSIIKLEEDETEEELIDQIAYYVEDAKKGPLLRYLIKNHMAKQVLIFTSSKDKADKVTNKLRKNGLNARAIHGNKSQGNRRSTLDKFKKNEINILVTTDLLSRGIDIEFLPLVINYELPRSPKDFVHRIGRTGRAENKGQVISLVSDQERLHFKVIQKKMDTWTELIDSTEINLHGY
jgi:ATP-dependent RNA helicase RhlE